MIIVRTRVMQIKVARKNSLSKGESVQMKNITKVGSTEKEEYTEY